MKSTYYMPSSVSTKEKWIDEYLNRRLRFSPPRKATFGFSDEAETSDDDSDDPSPPPSQLTGYTTADEIVTATPSPIPIPACNISHYNAGHRRSYHHSPTPAQSSCVTVSHRKFKSPSKDAPAEAEIEAGRRSAASRRPPPLHHRRSHHSPLRNRTGTDACSARPTRSRRSHHRARSIGRSFPHVLQAVDEEEWETRRERGRRPSTSRYLWPDDGYYPQAGYETPDIESRGRRRPFSSVAATAKSRRKDTEGRIAALREARITELKNKLMKEEAAIDLREKKQIAVARRDMKEFELKLEKTRAVEMDKMLRRFRRAQKEAKKMKVKEQQETDKKIAKVIEEFNDIAISGKVPRKCMICF